MSIIGKEPTQMSPATLGDVLYAKSRTPVPEEDWATLVQSIAAGDQYALMPSTRERIGSFHFDHKDHGQPRNR